MKKEHRYFIAYGCILLAYLLGKWWYRTATNDDLYWLLAPTNKVVSWVYNSAYTYQPDNGFEHPILHILINKSCSGFNFLLMSGALIAGVSISILSNTRHQMIATLGAPLLAILITIFANTSRILTSLLLERNMGLNYSWLHQAEGIFIYFSFLLMVHIGIRYSLTKINNYYA